MYLKSFSCRLHPLTEKAIDTVKKKFKKFNSGYIKKYKSKIDNADYRIYLLKHAFGITEIRWSLIIDPITSGDIDKTRKISYDILTELLQYVNEVLNNA